MKKPKLIIIRGYPGSGKTTIGKLLEKNNVGVFIDHNSILTFLAGIVGNDDGIYDEIHALETAMAMKLLKDNKNAIVARGFSSSESIGPYREVASKSSADVFIFRLVVSEENLKSRVVADERKQDFNPTNNVAALLSWISSNPLQNIEDEYEINADESIDKILFRILKLLGSRPES